MTDKQRAALKQIITEFCIGLSCSGLSPDSCPGNPGCDIVRKAMPWVKDVGKRLADGQGEVSK